MKKNEYDRLDYAKFKSVSYKVLSYTLIIVVAILFTFPLYWIVTGAFKTTAEVYAKEPVWWPSEWTWDNMEKLTNRFAAPLFEFKIPALSIKLGEYRIRLGQTMIIRGPQVPAVYRWLANTVFMSVMSMILTCVTAAMAGYVLAKKKFWGRGIVFGLIVCAMALPKQVIMIPLLKIMGADGLNMRNTLWGVIFPIVGWPFGVFLLKQFSEGIPSEMVEACRIDGASEWRAFTDVMFPLIKPGVGALAIFTFVNSWNDYFMQLLMLSATEMRTISVGIAMLQGENTTDFGMLMAGAALAAAPIILIFIIFQKYFTKGITMGAVKG